MDRARACELHVVEPWEWYTSQDRVAYKIAFWWNDCHVSLDCDFACIVYAWRSGELPDGGGNRGLLSDDVLLVACMCRDGGHRIENNGSTDEDDRTGQAFSF